MKPRRLQRLTSFSITVASGMAGSKANAECGMANAEWEQIKATASGIKRAGRAPGARRTDQLMPDAGVAPLLGALVGVCAARSGLRAAGTCARAGGLAGGRLAGAGLAADGDGGLEGAGADGVELAGEPAPLAGS